MKGLIKIFVWVLTYSMPCPELRDETDELTGIDFSTSDL